MSQPPEFVDSTHPQHVCKVNKAIYGLKQAPGAWFVKLCSTFSLGDSIVPNLIRVCSVFIILNTLSLSRICWWPHYNKHWSIQDWQFCLCSTSKVFSSWSHTTSLFSCYEVTSLLLSCIFVNKSMYMTYLHLLTCWISNLLLHLVRLKNYSLSMMAPS